MDALRSSRGTR